MSEPTFEEAQELLAALPERDRLVEARLARLDTAQGRIEELAKRTEGEARLPDSPGAA